MIALGSAPLLIGLALFGFAARLGRWLRPGLAVPLLTMLSLTVALSTGLVLSAAAVLACAQLQPMPRLGQWSASALRTQAGLPMPIGLAALVIVVGCLWAAVLRAVSSARSLRAAHQAVRLLRPTTGDLVLLDDDDPIAYSVAAMRGRIVISSAMLKALSGPERRVLLAHESAHLRHHHHMYLHLVGLAAAANPLLRPIAVVVAHAVERWADEEAAAETGDRTLTARALARAALAGRGRSPAAGTLGAVGDGVVERVRRLLAPAPTQSAAPVAIVVVATLLSWVAAGTTAVWASNLIQLAESAYPRS